MLITAGEFAAGIWERWRKGRCAFPEFLKTGCKAGPAGRASGDLFKPEPAELEETAETYYLCPAFYDLQVNGYDGIMLDASISREALSRIAASMREDGVFRFVPTVITCSFEHMAETLKIVRECQPFLRDSIPGVHLEGPFISRAKKGIHEERFIRSMTAEDLQLLLEYRDAVSYITADPAAVPPEYLKRLVGAGIRVSLGHTAADAARAGEFFRNGATLATHLHNAMSHARGGRDPMAVEAVLASDTVYAGVIADGIHVAWPEIRIARKCLGKRLVLVTDALAAAGVREPLASFRFAGTTVYNDPVRGLVNKDGTLGGSRLTMLEGVRNLVQYGGFSEKEALYAASEAPFQAMGETPEVYLILDSGLNIRGAFKAG